MIEDLIELGFAQRVVRSVVQTSDGCDEYLLERAHGAVACGNAITVRVRPDGKFARAASTEGLLSLGQVMTLCGLGRCDGQTTTPSWHGEVAR